MTTTASFNGLRAHLADSLTTADADDVMATLREAMKSTKTRWGHCPKCQKAVQVEVQDATAAVNALKLLIEQLEGRPGVQTEADTGPSVVITRLVAGTQPAQQEPSGTALAPGLATPSQTNAQAQARDAV